MPELDDVLPGLWRWEAEHPEWTEQEGGEDGWDPVVSSWAVRTARGIALVDPLVPDWSAVDALLEAEGGCVGVVRTIHWHQRSIGEAAERYGAGVWAMEPSGDVPRHGQDHVLRNGDELWGGIRAFAVHRDDELALWLPDQAALLFSDVMLRRSDGTLRVCPDSWTVRSGGPGRLRDTLRELTTLPLAHALVCHGPSVTGDGPEAMAAALSS